jgi:rapamycin-insensitive companion of mTOR
LLEEENAATWTLELLVTQLYDPAFEVCEAAAHYLEAACEELHVLEAVVDLRPTLDHLGDVGQCLLMR